MQEDRFSARRFIVEQMGHIRATERLIESFRASSLDPAEKRTLTITLQGLRKVLLERQSHLDALIYSERKNKRALEEAVENGKD